MSEKDHICRDHIRLMFRERPDPKNVEVVKYRGYCTVCKRTYVLFYCLEKLEEYKQ